MKLHHLPPSNIALLSAILFGLSTPFAKLLTGELKPALLAGILYLGSGLGLMLLLLSRRENLVDQFRYIASKEGLWMFAAIVCGGMAAPVLLMNGLSACTGSAASLLLNLEAVFTALFAWCFFRENFDSRIFIGMLAIVIGSVVLCAPSSLQFQAGSLSIVAACFCWALDNNLTRNVQSLDARFLAAIKGLVAGSINTCLAFYGGASSSISSLGLGLLVGFVGYGLSLVLFINSLRSLGTARTGAYFSTAPFVGAIVSLFLFRESLTWSFMAAAIFMAYGVWLHLTENHAHDHHHLEEEHEHMHTHDEHHQHEHDFPVAAGVEHSHWHRHEAITHSHPHYPDVHHRHKH